MGFGLLFVPLVGGYLFLTWCNLTRFAFRRESGYRLVFGSAATGMLLLAISHVLIDVANRLLGNTWSGSEYVQTLAPFPYISTIALAFVLGPVTALLVNCVYSESRGAMREVHGVEV